MKWEGFVSGFVCLSGLFVKSQFVSEVSGSV